MNLNLDLPDNVTLDFNANGVEVFVSLNIPTYLKVYISPNNLYKAKQFYIYKLGFQLESKYITKKNILEVHQMLLVRLMTHIRDYKSLYYKQQAQQLRQHSYKQLTLEL
jgi:hypothetical protein